jgi:hypothetical protein
MSDKLLLMKQRQPIIFGTPETLISDGTVSAFFSSEKVRFDAETGRFGISGYNSDRRNNAP